MIFSAPCFFRDDYVEFVKRVNSQNPRYRIGRVFNSLSYYSKDNSGFEYGKSGKRGEVGFLNTIEELEYFVRRFNEIDVEFVYLMNFASSVSAAKFRTMIPNLERFTRRLVDIGVKYVTVANQMLADYLYHNFGDKLNIGVSTMMHTDSVGKAKNLVDEFKLKYMVLATDVNKDFDFIEGFKELLPDVELEVMANEGCIFTCPTKNFHYGITGLFYENMNAKELNKYMIEFPKTSCRSVCQRNGAVEVIRDKIVYPWELPFYEKAGVDNIKLVGRNQDYEQTLRQIETYMLGVDGVEAIKDRTLYDITIYFPPTGPGNFGSVKLENLYPYLPKIEYFIENRPNCRAVCGTKCKYCVNLATKMESEITALEPGFNQPQGKRLF